jgi:hypothetical protein
MRHSKLNIRIIGDGIGAAAVSPRHAGIDATVRARASARHPDGFLKTSGRKKRFGVVNTGGDRLARYVTATNPRGYSRAGASRWSVCSVRQSRATF